MSLQVQRTGPGRAGDEVDDLRMLGITNVKGGDAIAEPMANICVAAMHHDLNAVGAAVHVGVANELDVAGCNSIHLTFSPTGGHVISREPAAANPDLASPEIR